MIAVAGVGSSSFHFVVVELCHGAVHWKVLPVVGWDTLPIRFTYMVYTGRPYDEFSGVAFHVVERFPESWLRWA